MPWPTLVEYPLIQTLTRLDVRAACELLGWLGIPAIAHGNVIEVAAGPVGIDDACSGIRSFQSTLMISLFVGEYYQMSVVRRLFLCLVGFSLAVLLNLVRQIVLVWVAAHQGIPAIARWHDPTGVIILLGCFLALWGIGVWLAPRRSREPGAGSREQRAVDRIQNLEFRSQKAEVGGQRAGSAEHSTLISALRAPRSALRSRLSGFSFQVSILALTGWLLLVEVGVEGWYRYHEARLPAPVTWRVAWPTNNATFKEEPLAANTRQLLRFTEAFQAAWEEDALNCQVIFAYWKPGGTAQLLAGEHTPQTCLGASGHRFVGGTAVEYLMVHNLQMPFRFYQLTDSPQPTFVAYCLWDDRGDTRSFHATQLSHAWRLPPVLAGQRNPGQRVIEIALTGVNDLAAAHTAVRQLLEKIIVPER